MRQRPNFHWLLFALILIILNSSCGVKAPPTPILSAPPSPLQQEAERRKLEKSEKEKQPPSKSEGSKK